MTFFTIMSFRHNERSWVHNAVIDHRAGFDRSAFISVNSCIAVSFMLYFLSGFFRVYIKIRRG